MYDNPLSRVRNARSLSAENLRRIVVKIGAIRSYEDIALDIEEKYISKVHAKDKHCFISGCHDYKECFVCKECKPSFDVVFKDYRYVSFLEQGIKTGEHFCVTHALLIMARNLEGSDIFSASRLVSIEQTHILKDSTALKDLGNLTEEQIESEAVVKSIPLDQAPLILKFLELEYRYNKDDDNRLKSK